MKLDHGRWPFSMVRVLEIIVLKALGPSLGVNRMWIKKNDHAPKIECATYPKRAFKKKSSLTILLSSFRLHLSLLVKCVEDVVCKSSHNNFTRI